MTSPDPGSVYTIKTLSRTGRLSAVLALVLFAAGLASAAREPGVTARASVSAPRAYESSVFSVRIALESVPDTGWEMDAPVLSAVKNCLLVASSVTDLIAPSPEGGVFRRTWVYTLKAGTRGTAVFGAVGIKLRHGKEQSFVTTDELSVEVVRSPLAAIRWICLAAALLALAALVFRFRAAVFGTVSRIWTAVFKPKSSAGSAAPLAREPTPAERLFAEFAAFRNTKAGLSSAEYFDALMRFLRSAVCELFAPGRKNLTDGDLAGLLPADHPLRPGLVRTVEAATAVRFADRQPSPEDAALVEALVEKMLLSVRSPPSGAGPSGGPA